MLISWLVCVYFPSFFKAHYVRKGVSKSIRKIPSPPPFSNPRSAKREERQRKDNPGEETKYLLDASVGDLGGYQLSLRSPLKDGRSTTEMIWKGPPLCKRCLTTQTSSYALCPLIPISSN